MIEVRIHILDFSIQSVGFNIESEPRWEPGIHNIYNVVTLLGMKEGKTYERIRTGSSYSWTRDMVPYS
jgi:hypothetical protein